MRPAVAFPSLLLFLVGVGRIFPLPATEEAELRRRVDLLERAGDYRAALPYYQQLHRLAPGDSTVVHGLARSLGAVDLHQPLIELLEPWLNDHPDDLQAYQYLGDAHLRLGNSEQALQIWRLALKRGPPRPERYLHFSDRCQAAGLYDAAIRFLAAGRRDLDQPDLFSWELAQLYLHQEEYARAVEAYLVALRQNPERYPLVEGRLLALTGDGRTGSRIVRVLQDARARAKGDQRLQISLLTSTLLLESKDPQAGLQILAEVADRPEIADLLFQYASRCEERGYLETAKRAYALFAERRADSPYLYRSLLRQAGIAVRTGDYGRAMELYGRLAQRYPDKPEAVEALFHLGHLQLGELDDAEGARVSLETVLESPGGNQWTASALELLAECALRQEDLAAAAAYLDRLQHLEPGAAFLARFRRAELRFFQADFSSVRDSLEQLLAENPAHELANDAIELLLLCEEFQDQEPALARFARSLMLERQHRLEAAEEDWSWLAGHAPSALRQLSLLHRARIREAQGATDRALALYADLLDAYPRGRHAVEAGMAAARLHEARGELEKALRLYETVLLAAPEDARAPEIRLHIQRLRRAGGQS